MARLVLEFLRCGRLDSTSRRRAKIFASSLRSLALSARYFSVMSRTYQPTGEDLAKAEARRLKKEEAKQNPPPPVQDERGKILPREWVEISGESSGESLRVAVLGRRRIKQGYATATSRLVITCTTYIRMGINMATTHLYRLELTIVVLKGAESFVMRPRGYSPPNRQPFAFNIYFRAMPRTVRKH